MNLFEIKRRSNKPPVPMKAPVAAAPRGLAIMVDPNDTTDDFPKQGIAAAAFALGFLPKDVTADGASLTERIGVFPGRIELEAKVGDEIDLDPLPEAYECEGSQYILTSGTGAITSGTALGTLISFVDGKARVKQTNDVAQYSLQGKPAAEVNGNLRLYLERL